MESVGCRVSLAAPSLLLLFAAAQLLPLRDKGHFRPLLFLAFLLSLRQKRKEQNGTEGEEKAGKATAESPLGFVRRAGGHFGACRRPD